MFCDDFRDLSNKDEQCWQEFSNKIKKLKKKNSFSHFSKAEKNCKDFDIIKNLSVSFEEDSKYQNKYESAFKCDKFIRIGDASKISKSVKKRIISGEYKIEAFFDCHGKTSDDVSRELPNFIIDCHNRGFKLVKIITGFGDRLFQDGIIRANIESYINCSYLKPIIRFACWGNKKNCGAGALIVFLAG